MISFNGLWGKIGWNEYPSGKGLAIGGSSRHSRQMVKIAWFSLLFLLVSLPNCTIACTTFLISGKYTADGKPLLFKNRDTDQMQNALAYFQDGKYNYI